jgi:hypothetical protein
MKFPTTFVVNAVAGAGKSCSTGAGAESLEKAIEVGIYESLHMKAVDHGRSPFFTVTEVCAVCYGDGEVTHKKYQRKRCPSCRGIGKGMTIGPIPITMTDYVHVVTTEELASHAEATGVFPA